MKTLYSRFEDGFTLVEILISMVILSAAIIGIVAVLPQGLGQVTQSSRVSTLNHLAQQKIDSLRSTYYTHPDLVAGDHPTTVEVKNNNNEIPSGYYRKWHVQDSDPVSGFKRVTVEVGYRVYTDSGAVLNPTKTANSLKIKMSTYISQ